MRFLSILVLILISLVAADAASTIPDARRAVDGASFTGNALVTAAFPGYFYVRADDRACGIRVEMPNHGLSPGQKADIVGTLRSNPEGERYIDAISAEANGSGLLEPILMSNASVGGGDWFYTDGSLSPDRPVLSSPDEWQDVTKDGRASADLWLSKAVLRYTPSFTGALRTDGGLVPSFTGMANTDGGGQRGVLGGIGLNNIGLLIRTTGVVTYSAPGFFYIDDGSSLDDGSGHKGIRVVPFGPSAPPQESHVSVTGISSCYGTGFSQRPNRLILASDAVAMIKEAASTTWFAGLNGVNNADILPTWTEKLHELSVGWIRMGHDMSWQTVEPAQDQWNFAGVDAKVTALQNNGFKILPILCYTADWAAGPYGTLGAAANQADWEDYVRTIVSRYIGPPYNVKYWQVWNEPTVDAWFRGADNQEFIDKIYLPAARIIREYGGYVVFGGWPVNNTIASYEAILNYNNAWQWTDYADIHYFNIRYMETLYNNWVATGKLRGIWQTEIGWKTRPGYLPNLYPRVLRFSLDKNAKSPDMIKLFWYASWSTGADVGKSFLEGDWSNPAISNPNGTRLKVLADLFSGAPVHVRHDVTLISSPAITFQMAEGNSSYEAFAVGGKTIVCAHVKSTSGITQLGMSWPSSKAPSRVRRISSAGAEQDLSFTWSDGTVSVTVPLSGLPIEDAYASSLFQHAYVVADR